MTEDRKHLLDELSISDMMSYLGARISNMEESVHRKSRQIAKAKEIAEISWHNKPLSFKTSVSCEAYTEAFFEGLRAKDNEVMELKEAVKQLTIALHETTYSDNIQDYGCPSCSCADCYYVSCKYNSSKLFKKIYEKYPELYENEETGLSLKESVKVTDK